MTVYTITSATSIFSSGTVAFQNGTPAADTLSVQAGAHVIAGGAVGTGKNAIWLKGAGAWTVSINGDVLSTEQIGLRLDAGLPLSTISIGTDGNISGTFGAIEARSPVTITNRGGMYLTGNAAGAEAVSFFGTGEHRLTNYGVIDTPSGNAIHDVGNVGTDIIDNRGSIKGNVFLGGGDDWITNSGGFEGSVADFGSGNNRLTNRIGANFDFSASFGSGNDIVINDGLIYGSLALAGGQNNLTNRGLIGGTSLSATSGNDIFSNSGDITVTEISMGLGTNRFTNTGQVNARFIGGTGVDAFNNSGVFKGDIRLLDGSNVFNNSGSIDGNVSFGTGNDIAVNSGTIALTVDMSGGVNRFTNSGVLKSNYFGSSGILSGYNIFTNYIINGAVKTSGTVLGGIFLSAGNDRFYGGDNAEDVYDSVGADRYELAGGDDIYHPYFVGPGLNDLVDYADGGAGSDTLVLVETGTTGGQTIVNLDTVAHSYGLWFADPNGGFASANRVTSEGNLVERVFNFENVVGSFVNDVIHGSAAANRLEGGFGHDVLHGYAGNDILVGGSDMDILVGGSGRDVLTGGQGIDFFIFLDATDSVLGGGRDVITDFNPLDGERIALNAIDANTTNAAGSNDAFTAFIGVNTPFAANTPGTLRAVWSATGWIVEGNTDNDTAPEFQIAVTDQFHVINWSMDLFLV